mgnify:CR=1 FL=1
MSANFEYVEKFYNEDDECIGQKQHTVAFEFCAAKKLGYEYLKTSISASADCGGNYWILHNQAIKLAAVREWLGDRVLTNHQQYEIDGVVYVHWLAN